MVQNARRDAITGSLIFFVIGFVVLIIVSGNLATAFHSLSLTSTRAVVTGSNVSSVSSTNSDGDIEYDDVANIRFRYWVEEEELEGSGVYLADSTPKTSLFLNANQLVSEYAPGTETPAYYDPGYPARVCLRRGLGPSSWAMIGFLLFMFGVGAFILLWGFNKRPGLLRIRKRTTRRKR